MYNDIKVGQIVWPGNVIDSENSKFRDTYFYIQLVDNLMTGLQYARFSAIIMKITVLSLPYQYSSVLIVVVVIEPSGNLPKSKQLKEF